MDPENIDAIEKAARAAAGLPELPDPAKDQKQDDQTTDTVTEALRAAAGLPPTIPVESTRKG